MRVLHLLNHSLPHQDGYCIRSREIIRNLNRIGIETAVATSPRHSATEYSPQECIEGTDYFRTKPLNVRLPVWREYRESIAFERRVREVAGGFSPDILHAHSPATCGWVGLRISRELRIPFVYEMRGNWEDAAVDQGRLKPSSLKYLLSRRLETYIADRSNRLACICEGLRADLASRVCDKNKDIVVFPNAVEMGDFPGREPDQGLIRKLGLQGKSVVAYLGSLSHWEGVEVLVNAFSKVAKEISNAILLVIGGGDVEETIRQRMADSPMRDSMRFIGRVPHREVASYYSVINLLVYPRVSSRNTELCTPLKPLEAMAMGKPILVSDVGGLKELVPLSGNCCFPAGSSEHLSELIIQFLRDPDRLEKLGESGREHVMLGRQWSQAIGRYKDVYELLLRS